MRVLNTADLGTKALLVVNSFKLHLTAHLHQNLEPILQMSVLMKNLLRPLAEERQPWNCVSRGM